MEKYPLDKGCNWFVTDENGRNFFEKGIDFMGQRLYNVKLYENNEKGDATNAQH